MNKSYIFKNINIFTEGLNSLNKNVVRQIATVLE